MRPAGAAATAATAAGLRAGAAAAASGSGRPRLTCDAVRLKDRSLDYRSDDLTAIDRGAGERQEARELRATRVLCCLRPSGGNSGPAMCPARRPGHAVWKRDFLGASGLSGVILKPALKEQVYAMIVALDLVQGSAVFCCTRR